MTSTSWSSETRDKIQSRGHPQWSRDWSPISSWMQSYPNNMSKIHQDPGIHNGGGQGRKKTALQVKKMKAKSKISIFPCNPVSSSFPGSKGHWKTKPNPARRQTKSCLTSLLIFYILLDVYIPLKVRPYANRERWRLGCGGGGGGGKRGVKIPPPLTRDRKLLAEWVNIKCHVWRELPAENCKGR